MATSGGGEGGTTVLPMVLPKQSSKPPQMPMPETVATDVHIISAVNPSNQYMLLTPEIYNIQMFSAV